MPDMARPKKINGYDHYEIESAADSLIRAEEIRNNPKLYPLAMKEVQKKAAAAQQAANVRKKLAAAFPRKKS